MFKIIELKNKNLVSCSKDRNIIFYRQNKSKYKKDYKYFIFSYVSSLIQTKDNEICFSSTYYEIKMRHNIYFYDYNQKKTIQYYMI